jgi:hypothetical protein
MANYSIPTWELPKSNKQQFRKAALESLIKRARELAFTSAYYDKNYPLEEPRDLTIRELKATDLGLVKWGTPKLTPNTYIPWVDHSILANNIIVIFAVSLLSKVPHVTSIRAGYPSMVWDFVEVEKLQVILPLLNKLRDYSTKDSFSKIYDLSEIVMEAYLSEPWKLDPGNLLRLEVFSPEAAPGDRILLRGLVAEPKGMNIA